jgi:hypothetical protein
MEPISDIEKQQEADRVAKNASHVELARLPFTRR